MTVNRAVQPTLAQGEPLESYKLVTIPKPKASPNNVVVRVVLRPVNPTDLLTSRWGAWANLDLSTVVVGSEGVGLIEEVGEGVTKVKVGQKVIPLIWSAYYPTGYGLRRDYVEVPEIDLIPVPDDMSDEIASQFMINPSTAYGLLKRLDIPKGGYFLQTAAGSALGRQMIGIAKHYGVKSINIIRRDEWIQPLTDLGADYVINSKTEDVKARVMEITEGKGAYGATYAVAGEFTRVVASCVRDGGSILVYGGLSGSHAAIDLQDLMRSIKLSFFMETDYKNDLPKREETIKAVFELLSKKVIDPLIGKTYPLEDFKEAIKASEKDVRGGKVFLSSY